MARAAFAGAGDIRAMTSRNSPHVATMAQPGRVARASVASEAPVTMLPAMAMPSAAPNWPG